MLCRFYNITSYENYNEAAYVVQALVPLSVLGVHDICNDVCYLLVVFWDMPK